MLVLGFLLLSKKTWNSPIPRKFGIGELVLFYETDLVCKISQSVLTKDFMIFEIQGNTDIGR